jgi:hypothetical protein
MARELFIKQHVDNYKDEVKQAKDDNELERVLTFFAKDIERETRQSAVSLAYKLASDINELFS